LHNFNKPRVESSCLPVHSCHNIHKVSIWLGTRVSTLVSQYLTPELSIGLRYMLGFRSCSCLADPMLACNSLTPWSWARLERPSFAQLLKNLPIFCGALMFITMFTTAGHWSLSWARWAPPFL
jgi:hypothetical protein